MSWLRATDPAPPSAPSADPREFALPDGAVVTVRWVRDARARRLRLIVNDRGIRLTLPPRASERHAATFLQSQGDWLQAQLAKRPVVEVLPFSPERDHALQLRGESVPITWADGRYTRIDHAGDGLLITRPAKATPRQLRSALKEFYLQEARKDVGQWLPKYLPTLPRAHSALRLRPLSSLWGSLSPSNALSLDLALVLGQPEAFEYVLVHELCHLLQRNHSRKFWREVEARWPDWRGARRYLHGDGLALKGELRRCIA
jgi:predicted metal-dependent hydrolase